MCLCIACLCVLLCACFRDVFPEAQGFPCVRQFHWYVLQEGIFYDTSQENLTNFPTDNFGGTLLL